MPFSLKTPAKINWTLSIRGKREDGYHDIISPMQCVSVFDTLTFEPSEKIELLSDLDLPVSENLVYKAAALLREYSTSRQGARISLKKEIPSAAGLGGGSSDAAAALMGLNSLWGLNISPKELMELGARIGSDVPFFMSGPFSLVEGRGERVSPIRIGQSVHLLLVKPDIAVSTAWAYGAYEPELTKKSVDIKLFCQALERGDFSSLRHVIFNDLEKAVIGKFGIIGELKSVLVENGAMLSSMSGSGPTVFGLFGSQEQARRAAEKMTGVWARVVETLI